MDKTTENLRDRAIDLIALIDDFWSADDVDLVRLHAATAKLRSALTETHSDPIEEIDDRIKRIKVLIAEIDLKDREGCMRMADIVTRFRLGLELNSLRGDRLVLMSRREGATKPAVPSDMDHGKEGDPQEIWDNRLRHLDAEDRACVDEAERRLIQIVTDRPLKRRLRGGVGWDIGKNAFLPAEEAIKEIRSAFDASIAEMLRRSA